jgi:hypothetical protein
MAFNIITERDRQEWAELKETWSIWLIHSVLAGSWLVAAEFFGRGWSVIVAALAVAIWVVIRPWRIGFLPAERRRKICFTGGIVLCAWAIVAALAYAGI